VCTHYIKLLVLVNTIAGASQFGIVRGVAIYETLDIEFGDWIGSKTLQMKENVIVNKYILSPIENAMVRSNS